MKRDLLSIADLTGTEIAELMELTARIKASPERPEFADALRGKTLGLLLEKPSTRTRISFEVAMNQMGGSALLIDPKGSQMGRGETLADTARTLSRYLDGIMIRTFAQNTLAEWAEAATMPVINGLSDLDHPCQALADLFTIREQFGTLAGITLAYVGDGNNMANSLLLAAARTGMPMRLAHPKGYAPDPAIARQAMDEARQSGGSIHVTHDPAAAVHGAQVVYTDVWTSMGQEAAQDKRRQDFAGYQVNERLMGMARQDAIFLHCLPAHRGEEVASGVLDGPRSRVFDQAENRLHIQKAILYRLVGPGRKDR